MRWLDSEAVGQVLAFLVAGGIFLGIFGAIVWSTRDSGSDDLGSSEASRQARSERLADLMVGSAGVGWAGDADLLTRLGLRASNGSGLEPSSLAKLRGALENATANDKVDYAEAQLGLGIDPAGTEDFHLRIYPLDDEAGAAEGFDDVRVAYIADWTSLVTITLPVLSANAQQANVQLNATMTSGTALERDAIDALGAGFNNRVYISTLSPTLIVDVPWPLPDLPLLQYLNLPLIEGDVYPDIKTYLDFNFPARLPQYDILVVGSNVDHNQMTSQAVKDAIKAFVEGGGTLIVFGSDSQAYEWLQPIFQVGIKTVNGGVTAPDIGHPILQTPNVLDWPHYNNYDQGWDIRDSGSGAHYADFTHVVVQGGEDVLAVSKEGAFGDGRIILTTYRPQGIATLLGQGEAEHFIDNLLHYSDLNRLYLDYGPERPELVPVAVAVRQSHIWDPELGQVPVRIELHLWG